MSARKITAALCMLWQYFHLSSCSIAYMKYSKLKAINWGLPLAGHKLNVTPIATSRVTNHIKCMAHCAKTMGCVATNLGPAQAGQHECEMLKTTRYSILNVFSAKIFTAKAGWTYIGPKVYYSVRYSAVLSPVYTTLNFWYGTDKIGTRTLVWFLDHLF
jgi:hypothetical protein